MVRELTPKLPPSTPFSKPQNIPTKPNQLPPFLSNTRTETMFSCANYQRGCRGRTNAPHGSCSDCVTLNLASTAGSSTSSSSPNSASSSASTAAYTAYLEALAAEAATDSDSTAQSFMNDAPQLVFASGGRKFKISLLLGMTRNERTTRMNAQTKSVHVGRLRRSSVSGFGVWVAFCVHFGLRFATRGRNRSG